MNSEQLASVTVVKFPPGDRDGSKIEYPAGADANQSGISSKVYQVR